MDANGRIGKGGNIFLKQALPVALDVVSIGGMKAPALFAAVILSLMSGVMRAEERPNVIFILADDLGYRELGCYGQEKIRTPRIDALAAGGMRFTRAYAGNAVCAPSRCVLMTGKHPGHATVRDNRSVEPEGQHPLRADEVTLAELFKKQGYACGVFGKWGLGNKWSTGNPSRRGFDRFFGYNCQAHAHSYYPATLWSDESLFPLKNDPPVPGHAGFPAGADPADPASYAIFKGQDYAPDHINGAALDFIRTHRNEPFFLYYPSLIPHVALHVPDEDLEPYLAEKWRDPPFTRSKAYGYTPHFTPRAAYAAMITRLDTYVGRVVDLVEELGLTERTIVVFTSDNGTTHLGEEVDYQFFASVGELRGLKGELFEGGIRVPQIVKWPGRIAPGSVSDDVTGFEDWLPTLMELIGSQEAVPSGLDGKSIAALLRGESMPEREFLYREFPGYGGQQAVWLGSRWKGIRTELKRGAKEPDLMIRLYDLIADPSEGRDVAGEHPDVVARITALMASERIPSTSFPFPALDALSAK
jgi:arylsulfatase A